jgi:integrase/recombinase XerD
MRKCAPQSQGNDGEQDQYFRASTRFFDWCEHHRIHELSAIESFHVAAYIEERGHEVKKPSVKQEFAAIRMLFNWLVVGQIVRTNPAIAVRGPRYSVRKGKTPILSLAEARQLLDSVDTSTIVGLRDRAIISTALYTFGRVNAIGSINVEDCYVQNRRLWIRLQEKNGKVIEMTADLLTTSEIEGHIHVRIRPGDSEWNHLCSMLFLEKRRDHLDHQRLESRRGI